MFYFINYSFIHFTYVGPMLIAAFVTEIVFRKYVHLFIYLLLSLALSLSLLLLLL